MLSKFDVAIVGCGPVGATLAALLAKRGLQIGLFDKSPEIYPKPRAIGLDHEAMRIFQELEMTERLAPFLGAYRPTIYIGVDGQPIQRIEMTPPPYPLSWPPNQMFNQPGLESVLRETVASFPSVTVGLGQEIRRVENTGTCVEFEALGADEQTQLYQAHYVVACDGAASPTRRTLGIRQESLDFDEPWIVVDVLVDENKLVSLPDTNVHYCEPSRPTTYIIGPHNHRRWEFSILPGETIEGDISEELLWRLLARWLKPGEAKIWRAATYYFHAIVAREWRRSRILLAGDAAHQMPPFLAQGMCQGLRDAGNLAWKLDWVLRGLAPDALLDTYQAERRTNICEIIQVVEALGRIIGERDVDLARKRDARFIAEQGGQVVTKIRQSMIPGLKSGLIAPWANAAGTVFPQPLVRSRNGSPVRLDDVTGSRLRLFERVDFAESIPQEVRELLVRFGGKSLTCDERGDIRINGASESLLDENKLVSSWLERIRCGAVLVRPDHYVLGAVRTQYELGRLFKHFELMIDGQAATN